jgi:hypothetical protein
MRQGRNPILPDLIADRRPMTNRKTEGIHGRFGAHYGHAKSHLSAP